LNRIFKNEKHEYRQNQKKKIPDFFNVLLFCRRNAMTATGTRERSHGMPDCGVVVGIDSTTVCMVPGGDVDLGVGIVTTVSAIFGCSANGIIAVLKVPVGTGWLN